MFWNWGYGNYLDMSSFYPRALSMYEVGAYFTSHRMRIKHYKKLRKQRRK